MRVVTSLAVTNAAVWIAFVTIFPGTHFAWPGSYKFWWFDDLPWAMLLVCVIALILMMTSPSKTNTGRETGLAVLLTITLVAVIPYAAFSGGGV